MGKSAKSLLIGGGSLFLLAAVALVTKQERLFFFPFFALLFFIGVILPAWGVIRLLAWISRPREGAPATAQGPTWRQALLILGSGVLLAGSTCFGAAEMSTNLFGKGDPEWHLPAVLLCGVVFLIALAITLVGVVKLLQRAVAGARSRA